MLGSLEVPGLRDSGDEGNPGLEGLWGTGVHGPGAPARRRPGATPDMRVPRVRDLGVPGLADSRDLRSSGVPGLRGPVRRGSQSTVMWDLRNLEPERAGFKFEGGR